MWFAEYIGKLEKILLNESCKLGVQCINYDPSSPTCTKTGGGYDITITGKIRRIFFSEKPYCEKLKKRNPINLT